MVHNYNAITNYASSNLAIDERTLVHIEYRHVLDGLMKRIEGKLNITKGGQIVLVVDSKSLILRVYAHRHKAYIDESFKQEGPRKVKKLMDIVEPLVIDYDNLNISLVCILFYSFTNKHLE